MVADFGIALAMQRASGARLTQPGLSLGTPSYVSAEHPMGERTVDARSDVYALGPLTDEALLRGWSCFTRWDGITTYLRVAPTLAPTVACDDGRTEGADSGDGSVPNTTTYDDVIVVAWTARTSGPPHWQCDHRFANGNH